MYTFCGAELVTYFQRTENGKVWGVGVTLLWRSVAALLWSGDRGKLTSVSCVHRACP